MDVMYLLMWCTEDTISHIHHSCQTWKKNKLWGNLHNTWPMHLKHVHVMKNKSWGAASDQRRLTLWYKHLNAVSDPGLDPGSEKKKCCVGHYGENIVYSMNVKFSDLIIILWVWNKMPVVRKHTVKCLGVRGHDVCNLLKLFRKCMCACGERHKKRKIKQTWQNVNW